MEKFESEFLKSKYWGKEEFREAVDESAQKAERLAEDEDFRVAQKPGEKIPYYLERLERIVGKKNPKTGEQSRLFLEKSLYPKYIIKPENISGDYIKGILLGNFAEQRGYERDDLKNEEVRQHVLAQFKQETGQDFSSYEIPEEERDRVRGMVVTDQKARMGSWYKYLTGGETRGIPPAFRYWAFAEMLKLGSFNEERKVFNKRTENTAASFPELNQQALALVFDEIQRKRTGEPSKLRVDDEARQTRFRELLKTEDFGKLYAFALEHVNSLRLPTERLIITKGEWRCFPKDTPASELTTTIDGFNTKWCIAGEGYAQDYLSRSDVWIYFSEDTDGQNSIPRACIVDSGEHGITEVRGIMSNEEAKQHLDSHITPVVAEKLKSMPGAEKWQSIMEDMKHLAKIHFKHLQNEPLNKEDLIFLYEIGRPIQSSGYDRDPRIEEIRKRRNSKEDAPLVLDCKPEEIAWSRDEINGKTKAYIGKLDADIFDLIEQHNIEQIYTSFPEGKVELERNFEAGPITLEEFEKKIEGYNRNIQDESLKIKIYDYAQDMMRKPEFKTLKDREKFTLVRLKVAALGEDFSQNGATTAEIIGTENDKDQRGKPAPFTSGRMTRIGLELCPPETGPYKRLKDLNQPMDKWYRIAMKPISVRPGNPLVFLVARDGRGLWLSRSIADSDVRWDPDGGFVFRLRKKDLKT